MRVDRVEQLARVSRWRHVQLGAESAREIVESTPRRRDLPGGHQPPDQLAVRVLPERIELHTATCDANRVRDRARRLGVGGDALEHVAEAISVRLPSVVDPLVVESREQLTVAEIDGLLQSAFRNQPVELPDVHDHRVADEPDRLTRGHDRAFTRRAERAPDRDKFGSQALASARVKHVRPKAPGDLRARMHPGVKREPTEERACPPTLGHRQCDPP